MCVLTSPPAASPASPEAGPGPKERGEEAQAGEGEGGRRAGRRAAPGQGGAEPVQEGQDRVQVRRERHSEGRVRRELRRQRGNMAQGELHTPCIVPGYLVGWSRRGGGEDGDGPPRCRFFQFAHPYVMLLRLVTSADEDVVASEVQARGPCLLPDAEGYIRVSRVLSGWGVFSF